jgi:hypothetical protein
MGLKKGETTSMLCTSGFCRDSTWQSSSRITMFHTALLQFFCFLIGNNGLDMGSGRGEETEGSFFPGFRRPRGPGGLISDSRKN